ncbi:hypothetical protein VC83_06176 [Pseudogymnoascus destructans]|nr:uncharacterized protein VC83_06176 [Pseudogymnoascus destructans]OAF58900.1 hypothetical protein VC83_06176 [Pseudogymnoascus destructans]
MDTATNFHRAHEKSSQENRGLIIQHRLDMELLVNDHKAVCDSHSQNEAVLREELATLQKKLSFMEGSCSYDLRQWKASANAMKEEIMGVRADLIMAQDASLRRDKKYIALLPGYPPKKQAGGSGTSEALDAPTEVQAKAMGMRLDKGKRIAEDIAEKRSREAAKDLAELPGSEFSKLQATFRKGMAEAEMDQGTKTKPTSKSVQSDHPTQSLKPTPTSKAVHSDQSTQPSMPKSTPVVVHSDKPTQPQQQPKSASAPIPSDGQPPKVPTTSKIPTPAKKQPEDQAKETPLVEAAPANSERFTIPRDASYWMKSHYAPVTLSGGVPLTSAEVERGCSIPLPVAKEQKPTAQGNNQA